MALEAGAGGALALPFDPAIDLFPPPARSFPPSRGTRRKPDWPSRCRRRSAISNENPLHPGLHTKHFTSLPEANREELFESPAQNKAPGANRIFWHYGPNQVLGKKCFPIITIVAITPPPCRRTAEGREKAQAAAPGRSGSD